MTTVTDSPNGHAPPGTVKRLLGRKPHDDREVHVYNVRMGRQNADGEKRKLPPGTVWLICAAVLLLLLAAGQGYVSFSAQFLFIYAAKHLYWPAVLEAVGLDTGAVIFALLGLANARMGRNARIERILNVTCAMGSMVMNLLGASLGSPRSIAVYVLPALLYAACSDRLIVTAGRAGGVEQSSTWTFLGIVALYGLRALVALPSTLAGGRRMILAAAPVPAAEPPVAALPAAGTSKRARLLALYAEHPDHGDRSRVSAVAAELAPQADLQPGTARTYLYAAVDGKAS